MHNIAIIGAGLSGLTAAHFLKPYADITIFEKSRGPGGRMATKYAEPYFFDHGAQFFNPKTDQFKAFIEPMIDCGIIKRWDGNFVEITKGKIAHRREWGEEYPHYVGAPGMDAIGKYLSKNLKILLQTRIRSIASCKEGWCLIDISGKKFKWFDYIIIAIPPEQAQALLSSTIKNIAGLDEAKMQGCFSLMLGFKDQIPIDFDAACILDEDISWISVNNTKPAREKALSLLIHSSNKWADEHLEDENNHVMSYLIKEASRIVSYDLSISDYKSLHRWRFANIGKQNRESSFLNINKKLGLCGDWFIKGRIESAFLSGFDLAKKIINNIK